MLGKITKIVVLVKSPAKILLHIFDAGVSLIYVLPLAFPLGKGKHIDHNYNPTELEKREKAFEICTTVQYPNDGRKIG